MILPVALTAGLLVGAGTLAVVHGIRPPLARLDRRVDQVLNPHTTPEFTSWRRWRDLLIARTPPSIQPDLALLDRSAAEFVTSRLVWAAGTLTVVTLVAA